MCCTCSSACMLFVHRDRFIVAFFQPSSHSRSHYVVSSCCRISCVLCCSSLPPSMRIRFPLSCYASTMQPPAPSSSCSSSHSYFHPCLVAVLLCSVACRSPPSPLSLFDSGCFILRRCIRIDVLYMFQRLHAVCALRSLHRRILPTFFSFALSLCCLVVLSYFVCVVLLFVASFYAHSLSPIMLC